MKKTESVEISLSRLKHLRLDRVQNWYCLLRTFRRLFFSVRLTIKKGKHVKRKSFNCSCIPLIVAQVSTLQFVDDAGWRNLMRNKNLIVCLLCYKRHQFMQMLRHEIWFRKQIISYQRLASSNAICIYIHNLKHSDTQTQVLHHTSSDYVKIKQHTSRESSDVETAMMTRHAKLMIAFECFLFLFLSRFWKLKHLPLVFIMITWNFIQPLVKIRVQPQKRFLFNLRFKLSLELRSQITTLFDHQRSETELKLLITFAMSKLTSDCGAFTESLHINCMKCE